MKRANNSLISDGGGQAVEEYQRADTSVSNDSTQASPLHHHRDDGRKQEEVLLGPLNGSTTTTFQPNETIHNCCSHPMSANVTIPDHKQKKSGNKNKSPPSWWGLCFYLVVLLLDGCTSIVLLTPLVKGVTKTEGLTRSHYSMHGSLWDLAILAIPRIIFALLTISFAYHRLNGNTNSLEPPFELYHKNGQRKSKSELEAEALAEPYINYLNRHVWRMPFLCEIVVLATTILVSLKCLARLNVEIGLLDNTEPVRPVFWIALSMTASWSLIELCYIDTIERLASELGQHRRREMGNILASTWVERVSGTLAQPLLSRVNSSDEENGAMNDNVPPALSSSATEENTQVLYELSGDTEYSASWSDLLALCEHDKHLIIMASVFLFGAAVTNVYIPKFTGDVLDALVAHATNQFNSTTVSINPDHNGGGGDGGGAGGSIAHIPGFVINIELLILVSILGGIFDGIRGAIFTMVGARVNTRLRIHLMDSLLTQEIGFFDTTRTGDITSRLSSDTTLVGSSITNNVNVFLRSVVRAVGVLIFMFLISWQLSLMAFLTVPVVSALSKWYGKYVRRLTKLQQKLLAEGNSVSEATFSSMPTVRACGAESVELSEFEECMKNYLNLNGKATLATFFYGTVIGTLPQLVKALVLFYGGLLVQSTGRNHITGGQLISFILYVNSLSEAFSSLGGIYASLVRAVGAADKVFELMNRKPNMIIPTHVDSNILAEAIRNRKKHLLDVQSTKVVEQRARGLHPERCVGDLSLRSVEFRYPSRPLKLVLDSFNLNIPAGSIAALVGVSGSGKSSIVKLLQHLYDVSKGHICIDDNPIQELSADWISKNVAIVSQEPTLFARSVKRNIIFGLEGTDAEPSQIEVEEAARLANAASFIEALPQGYDTEVGERGIQLSGGQKQRVAIARALVRRPRILLLDEATSALDSESEYVVQKAIDDMISDQRSLDGDPSRSMTVIIVAHRLSTVRNADCIFVIDKGKLVEQGSHDDLMCKEDGVYTALIRRQLGRSSSSISESMSFSDQPK